MIRYIHTLSAIAFYLLGSSFFLAYILMHNNIWANQALVWMNIGDLPLLCSGLLYGGLSVYRSLKTDAESSKILMLGILLPLAVLFILLLIANFW